MRKFFIRKTDDPSLFLVEVLVPSAKEGAAGDEPDEPEWGPIDEAWDLCADDDPEVLAEQHGGTVVRFDTSLQAKG
jgi:hypothetical protein